MTLIDLLTSCRIERLTPQLYESCGGFSCGNADLDDFFQIDYLKFGEKLASRTYAFVTRQEPGAIVSMFSVSNDSIRMTGLRAEDWNNIEYVTEGGEKKLKRWPGVLIGRFGTNINNKGTGYGSAVLEFIKTWFRSNTNKTGCRFLIVEALNNDRTLHFYSKNGFRYLYQTEENEAKSMGLNVKLHTTFPLYTRLMYFDLLQFETNKL